MIGGMLNWKFRLTLLQRYFRSKGRFFLLNVSITIAAVYLMIPLFDRESSEPLVLGYSGKYFLFLTSC